VHDLDMARFLMGSEPVKVLASGSCQVDDAIKELEGPEAFDTASIVVRFENGKDAIIDVCRKAVYGYDQRAEVLGQNGMVMSENMQPSTVRKFTGDFVGQADMPYDFFMSRYKEAYKGETEAFIDCLVNDRPAPCSGRDGLVALVMAMAAGVSATEERWVDFGEIIRAENVATDGAFGDFGSLLNEDGKLKSNWIRGALLSIEYDPNSRTDLQELWSIIDKDSTGMLSEEQISELISKTGSDVDATGLCKQVCSDYDGCATEISFEQFIEGWKKAGYDVGEQDKGLKGSFNFLS